MGDQGTCAQQPSGPIFGGSHRAATPANRRGKPPHARCLASTPADHRTLPPLLAHREGLGGGLWVARAFVVFFSVVYDGPEGQSTGAGSEDDHERNHGASGP